MEKEKVLNPVMWSSSEERIKSSQMYKFMQFINIKYSIDLVCFVDLHNWSILLNLSKKLSNLRNHKIAARILKNTF